MKKALLVLTFCVFVFTAKSQTASVEKSVYGVQLGFLGVYAHNESYLSDNIDLRTEVGLDSGIWWGKAYDGVSFVMAPAFTVEPRYYYNLTKRINKARSITGNSGNFISLKTTFHPDWFVISNEDNVNVVSDISFVPTWGIRRTIGMHFCYEAGFGIGYRRYLQSDGYYGDKDYVAVNLHLRIGYKF